MKSYTTSLIGAPVAECLSEIPLNVLPSSPMVNTSAQKTSYFLPSIIQPLVAYFLTSNFSPFKVPHVSGYTPDAATSFILSK